MAYNADLGIVELAGRGRIGGGERVHAIARAFTMAEENGARRFLLDVREADASTTVDEILDLAESVAPRRGRIGRTAVVRSATGGARDDAALYEMVCHNAEWSARVFPERTSALEWLTSDLPAPTAAGGSRYRIATRPDYVLVQRARGYEVVLSEQPAMLAELAAACEAACCRSALVRGPETRVRLSKTDIFVLGKAIADLDLRIAVVERHDAPTEDVVFLETVTQNRGGALRFFVEEDEARQWLRCA